MNRLWNSNKNGDTTSTQDRTDSDTVNIIVDLIGSTSYIHHHHHPDTDTTTDVSATLSPQPPPTSSFSVTDAVHQPSNDIDDDADDDDDEEHHEIMFEPAVAPTTDPKYYLPHNTTASTTFDNEDDSFYYAEEASLYSIAENSREDTIDNHTPIPPPESIPITAAVNTTDSHGSHSSSTDYHNNNNNNNNNTNNRSSSNSNSQGNTNSSHTTPPINNVTSFEQKREVGVELSYAGQRYRTTHNRKNEDEDVITKASDETLRTYYYQRTKTSKCGRSCCQYRWYHPKCRMMILLLIILLIGVVFLAASLTIYQSRTKQQQKSVASIEGSGKDPNTTTPTVAPTLLRSNNNNNGNNGNKPTKMPMSSDELKYIVSESHVYNSIKTCQGASTYFDTSTIQGQVFAQLVQEVSDQVVTTTSVTESDTPTYEFASHHTVSYLREKYGLNVFYLSTNGETNWKDTTNWMTMTNPCSGSSDTNWYGVQCSTSTTTDTITTTAASVSASTSTTVYTTTCDASQPHIVSIDVSNNQLSGILPNELCCLPCVERMNLSNNSITGDFLWCINEIPTLTDFNINFNPLLTTSP